ncbi:MAG: anti-sigma factor [Leptothrix sp. (in: b-proteobacteria)]
MDYSRPQRADRLAAEYVLGTLQGHARQRFEALLPAHPQLRNAVANWQEALMPLAASVPVATPSAEVWGQIEERLFGGTLPLGTNLPQRVPRWWERVRPWRQATAISLAAVLALGVLLLWPQASRPPLLVVLTPNSGPASFVATIAADGRSLVLAPIGGLTVDPSHTLELWAMPKQGVPRSLGVVSANRPTTVMRTQLLNGISAYALSIENPGGSRVGIPSSPMVSVGQLPP